MYFVIVFPPFLNAKRAKRPLSSSKLKDAFAFMDAILPLKPYLVNPFFLKFAQPYRFGYSVPSGLKE